MEHIAEAIRQARSYLGEHPHEARYTDSLATAVLGDGLRCTVTGPDGASMATDMPASVGGSATAPSPGWFLRAAEASCVATLIAMRAASLGVVFDELAVSVDSESDDRGILGVDESVPAGPFSTRVAVEARGVDDTTVRDIAEWALAHCPVTDAVQRAVPITLEVRSRP